MFPTYYLVRNGNVFAISELKFTSNYLEATKLPNVAEAMRMASIINKNLGSNSFKIFPMYD